MSAISCLAEPRLPVLPFHDSTACRQLWSCGTLGRPSILHPAMTGPSIFLQYLGLPKTHVAWTAAKTPALHQGSRGGGRLPRRNRYGAVGLGRLWSPDAIEGRAKRLRSTIGRPQNAHATVGSTAERRRCLLAVIPRETDGWSACYEIRPIGRGRPWGTGWRGLLFTRDANVRVKAFRGDL